MSRARRSGRAGHRLRRRGICASLQLVLKQRGDRVTERRWTGGVVRDQACELLECLRLHLLDESRQLRDLLLGAPGHDVGTPRRTRRAAVVQQACEGASRDRHQSKRTQGPHQAMEQAGLQRRIRRPVQSANELLDTYPRAAAGSRLGPDPQAGSRVWGSGVHGVHGVSGVPRVRALNQRPTPWSSRARWSRQPVAGSLADCFKT